MDPEKSKTEYKCNTITDVIGEEGNNAEMEDEVKDFEEDKGRRKEVLEKGKKRNIRERKRVCLLEKEGSTVVYGSFPKRLYFRNRQAHF